MNLVLDDRLFGEGRGAKFTLSWSTWGSVMRVRAKFTLSLSTWGWVNLGSGARWGVRSRPEVGRTHPVHVLARAGRVRWPLVVDGQAR